MSDPMTPKQWLKTRQASVRRELMLAVGVGLFGGLLLIVQAHYLGRIVNAVVIERHALHSVLPWLGMLLVVFAARFVVAWAVEEIAARAAVKIKVGLRDELYGRVTALGPTRLAAERSGELANTLVDGVEAMDAYFARYLPQMSLAALIPLAILAFVFPEDWVSGLILIITAPLIPFAMFLIGKGTEALNQKQWRKLARMSAHFLDMLQGITTLKLFNASRHEAEVIARISDDYRKATMSVLRVAFLSSLALEFFATVSIALVAVLIGFRLMWGDMDFQNGFFVLLLAPEFYLPLRNMGTYYHSRMEAIGA
ncbi:MAG: ABC transporter transmembrane domain-containing protein, partial [Gammaproteobacteria bacterium]